MKTITLGFFKSVLTDEEFDIVWDILCEYHDPDGVFTVDHLQRDYVDTESIVLTLRRRIGNYDKKLVDSILYKLSTNFCDCYSAFEKGTSTDYFYENLEVDDEDEYIEEHTLTKPLKFALLDDELLSQELVRLISKEYTEDELIDMFSVFETEEVTISSNDFEKLLEDLEDSNLKEKVNKIDCDYFLVPWEF